MSESVPVADAMQEAQAVLDAETLAVIEAAPVEETAPATSDAPVQVPLFEPPPFDFEQAYDELHRLDLRAKNRKAAWESLKAASRDAKEDYDSAINDLHDKFDEIDSARRVAAARQAQQTPHASATTEGGDEHPVSDMEATLGDEDLKDETPKDEPSEEKRDYDAGIGY